MKKIGVILLTLISLFSALPALAHTDLISTEPTTEQSLILLPAEVKLTFGEEILADGTFASLTYGETSLETTIRVEGADIYVAIASDITGNELIINYKTVASDGHPLEGQVVYALQLATEEVVESAPEITAQDDQPMLISAQGEENKSSINWLQWLSLGAAIGVAITFLLKMRKK